MCIKGVHMKKLLPRIALSLIVLLSFLSPVAHTSSLNQTTGDDKENKGCFFYRPLVSEDMAKSFMPRMELLVGQMCGSIHETMESQYRSTFMKLEQQVSELTAEKTALHRENSLQQDIISQLKAEIDEKCRMIDLLRQSNNTTPSSKERPYWSDFPGVGHHT